MLLEGKRALATGGGSGIGRGIVERFIAEGATVVTVQRRALDPSLAASSAVHGVSADLADPTAVSAVVDAATAILGGLDILVNNAGMMFESAPGEITVDDWDRMMALNLRAPMFVAQAALPHLRASGEGAIINISSIEAAGSNPGHAAYSAAKAGLLGLTRALAVDLGADGIRVNAIAPGWIDSDLSEAYLDSMPDPVAARQRLSGLHPLRRTGRATDIGDAAVFLAGAQSSFMTGETIVVDGGRTIALSNPSS